MHNPFKPRRNFEQDGYTLVELVISIGITSLFSALVLYFGFNLWRYSYLIEADQETLVTRLNIQDFIRKEIGASSGLITQNSLPDPNANNPDPIAGSSYWLQIHAIPTTTTASGSGTTPLVYYKKYSVDISGAYIYNGIYPFEDEYVLYLDNASKKIMQRTIANSAASGNKAKTSCPPAAATSTCPVDKSIGQDVSAVSFKYFSRSGNQIDWTAIYDPLIGTYIGPDFPIVEVAEFTVDLARKPVFQKLNATQNTTTIRIALRNT